MPQLRVKIDEKHLLALKYLKRKRNLDDCKAIEMRIERIFLAEMSILLVPAERVKNDKGAVYVEEVSEILL